MNNISDVWIEESTLPLTDEEIMDDASDILAKTDFILYNKETAYRITRFARAMQRSVIRDLQNKGIIDV